MRDIFVFFKKKFLKNWQLTCFLKPIIYYINAQRCFHPVNRRSYKSHEMATTVGPGCTALHIRIDHRVKTGAYLTFEPTAQYSLKDTRLHQGTWRNIRQKALAGRRRERKNTEQATQRHVRNSRVATLSTTVLSFMSGGGTAPKSTTTPEVEEVVLETCGRSSVENVCNIF